MKLFLRIYAHCPDDGYAVKLADRFKTALDAHDPSQDARPYPYWKIPGYYGFEFLLNANREDDFEAVTALARDGWEHQIHQSGRTSIWTHGADSTFLAVEVARAELQLVIDNFGSEANASNDQGLTANGSKTS